MSNLTSAVEKWRREKEVEMSNLITVSDQKTGEFAEEYNQAALVHVLEQLLGEVKKGKIQSLAIAATVGTKTYTSIAGRRGNQFQLLGAVTHLQHRLNTERIESQDQ